MTVYYVSTQGNDSDKGMQNAPWRHIQYACAQLKPGDTLRILPGAYDENILLCTNKNSIPGGIRQFATEVRSGTNQQKIVIQADDADNKPRITGSQRFGRFLAYDVSHWTIDGLLAENFEGSGIIFAALNSPQSGVTIRNCTMKNMWGGAGGGLVGNGIGRYAICVIGKHHKTFSDILIENNVLHHIIPGDESDGNECLDVVGKIDGAVIQYNSLSECYRIAINVLGADGTARNLTIDNGQPSNVIIRYNRITDMLQKANDRGPSKVGTPIYCDRAGENILIENNYMEQSNGWNSCTALQIGYEPGWADNTHDTRYVCIRNNVAINCRLGYQLGFGSNSDNFDKEPDGVACVHNVIVQKQTQQGVFGFTFGRGLNFHIKNNVIANRVTRDACRTRDVLNYQGEKVGPQPEPSSWIINGNLWQLTGGQRWEWGPDKFYTSLAALRKVGQGIYDQLATPVFVNEENGDYRLASNSPGNGDAVPLTTAIGAGTNSRTLRVQESIYFWPGDEILLGSAAVTVESVDRASNILMLKDLAEWDAGTPLHYKPLDTAPSVGLSGTHSIDSSDSSPITPIPGPEPGTILNSNPEFNNGLTDWRFYSSDGDYSVTINNGVVTARGTNGGSFTQLLQAPLKLIGGEQYTMVLRARRLSGDGTVNLQTLPDSGGALYLDALAELTSFYVNVSATFTALRTDENARIRLQFTGSQVVEVEFLRLLFGLTQPQTAVPVAVTGYPADVAVVEGGNAILTARFIGKELSYRWYEIDGAGLENDTRFDDNNTPELKLIDLSVTDSGTQYYCVASNSVGSARSRRAQLSVFEQNEELDAYERLIQRGLYVGVRFGAG